MKLTHAFKKVKLGCGVTVSARINEYGVLHVRIPNFRQTVNVTSGDDGYSQHAVVIVSPDSIAGLERILKAFKAASKGHEEA